jgi:hypothetical protein
MDVTFTKTRTGCATRCQRSDSSVEQWESPGEDTPPHDIVHWIVETKLGLQDSFYGNIAAGQDHYSVNELAHADTELASTELLVLLIQSEIATRRGTLHADPEAIRGLYGLRYPDTCGADQREEIIHEIEVAGEEWSNLSEGGRWLRSFPEQQPDER